MGHSFSFYWSKQVSYPNLTPWVGKYTILGINMRKNTYFKRKSTVVYNLLYRKDEL